MSFQVSGARTASGFEVFGATALLTEDPPQGTVTIDSVTPTDTTAAVAFSYTANDQSSFEYRLDQGTPVDIGNPSPKEFTIEGLTPETQYDLEMRAVNAFGESDWSAVATFTTQEETADPPGTAPANLSGDPETNSIEWTWDAVGDATGYEIEFGLQGGPHGSEDVGNTLSFSQTGLDPDTTYEARVRAYNDAGNGPWSDFVQVTTQSAEVSKTVTVQIDGIGARTGLRYAFFDSPNVQNWSAPSAQGTDGETDSGGNITIEVGNSTLSDGQWGYLYVTDNDGTLSASSHHGAPAQVTES